MRNVRARALRMFRFPRRGCVPREEEPCKTLVITWTLIPDPSITAVRCWLHLSPGALENRVHE
ncbi:hypothetical protein B296_00025974, partial [Ensete ventricosum]